MEPEFERDRSIREGRVADRLEESRAVGDVHAVEEPAPTRQEGGTPRSFVAAALALTTCPLRSCQVTRSSIACRSERSLASRRRAAVRRCISTRQCSTASVAACAIAVMARPAFDRRRPRLDRGPDAGGSRAARNSAESPAMALAASAARRDPESSASSGTATSHTAAPADTPPEVAAMQTTRPASDAEEIACASASRPLRDSTIAPRPARRGRSSPRIRARTDAADEKVSGRRQSAIAPTVIRARDEALVARALDRVVLGAIVHEPGQGALRSPRWPR